MKKRIVSLFLMFSLLLSSVPVVLSASIPDDSDYNSKHVSSGVSITSTVEKNTYKASVDVPNMAKVRDFIAADEESALDLCAAILIALGLGENTVERLSRSEILSMFADNIEITVEIRYVKVSEDGTETILSREECLGQAAIVESQRMEYIESKISSFMSGYAESSDSEGGSRGSINDGYDISSDSYVEIISISTYIDPTTMAGENGWYDFKGIFNWLSTPSDRYTDALSLYASGFIWSTNALDYRSTFTRTLLLVSNVRIPPITTTTTTIPKSGTERVMQSGGVYFSWDLPKDFQYLDFDGLILLQYKDFSFTIDGRARVTNYNSGYAFNLHTRYIHLKDSIISPSLGWESTGLYPGVKYTGGWILSDQAFNGGNSTQYTPSFGVTVSNSYGSPTGAGSYTSGSIVTIKAGTLSGYDFNSWTVNSGGVSLANASSATTTFTMQNSNVTVTANWKPRVNVNASYANPTGSGAYNPGNTVTIYAGIRSGYNFSGWTVNSGGVSLANASSDTTTFTMPNNPVYVTANWTPNGTPGWITYAESTFHPYGSGTIYRVPYELRYYKGSNGDSHYTYAYFDDLGDATQLADSWWQFQEEYIGPYDGGYLYCQVYEWTVQYYDNGNWYTYWKK